MTRNLLLLVLLMAVLALALRWPALDQRPFHNDEGVNAIKFGHLWQTGAYQYDPNEHHGPSLYYATWALGRLTAAPDLDHYSETRLRAVPVLFGLGLLLLLPLLVDGLGRRGLVWAALFTAVSPAMVFYSRYFIHEILLVFFTFLTLAGAWRYWRTRRLGWALLAGLGVGLMASTKETFVLTLAAAGLALFLNHTWNRVIDASGAPVKAPRLNFWHLAAGLAVCLVTALLFFSSFFTNPHGLLDSVLTYLPWMRRAGGESPHVHPWYFYLQRLLWFHQASGPVWTEGLIFLLALVGAGAGFARKRLGRGNASFIRFLALYTFLLTAFYSLLPYKTPWCLLSFWQGAILLAGVGAAVLLRSLRPRALRVVGAALILAGVAHLTWQAWQQDSTYAADRRNPYVYAQTVPDLMDLVAVVDKLGAIAPQGHRMLIQVISPEDDFWPLPWYLRQFKQVGWWHEVPPDPYAEVMIVSPALRLKLDPDKAHLMGFYGLRPQVTLALYVRPQLWQAWLAAQNAGTQSAAK